MVRIFMFRVVMRAAAIMSFILVSWGGYGWCAEPHLEGVLTRVTDVRSLSREAAALHPKVRLEGVVLLQSPHGCFFHDGHDSIWVDKAFVSNKIVSDQDSANGDPRLGKRILLEGVADPGGYAPQVISENITILGEGLLPEPDRPNLESLLSGTQDAQWIEMEGVVQDVSPAAFSSETILKLGFEGHSCVLAVQDGQNLEPARWEDARVRVRGCFSARPNLRGEIAGLQMYVAGIDAFAVVTPPPKDLFAVPRVALCDVMSFRANEATGHRKVTRGVVNFTWPGRFFFLQQGARGLRVESSVAKVRPGMEVDVAGFVTLEHTLAGLRGGLVRPTGIVHPPDAVEVTAARLLQPPLQSYWTGIAGEDFNGRLVTLSGKLLRVEPGLTGGELALLVDSGGSVFKAMLPRPDRIGPFPDWVEGAEISLTGVCELEFKLNSPERKTSFANVVGFHLWLPSPDAVQILRSPSWWTSKRLGIALGGTFLILVLALAWGGLLRREVARRGLLLAEEISVRREAQLEFQTTLRERTRLAHDLHDTLEQALTSLSLQLQAVDLFHPADQERSARHLRLAQQFLDRSREDVHRTVWNLRAQGLDGHSLLEALRLRTESMSVEGGVPITVSERGESVPLPDFIAGNLFLLALEAVTNALKHARAEHIRVELEFAPTVVTLRVNDDGCGFDPQNSPGHRDGHFGLQGMRERTKRIGATLAIHSSAGSGTRIEVEVPAAVLRSGD